MAGPELDQEIGVWSCSPVDARLTQPESTMLAPTGISRGPVSRCRTTAGAATVGTTLSSDVGPAGSVPLSLQAKSAASHDTSVAAEARRKRDERRMGIRTRVSPACAPAVSPP